MNKNHVTIAVSATLVASLAVAGVVQRRQMHQDLYERFPEIDPKVVRKAYARMMTKAITGQYDFDLSNWDDEAMDTLFKTEVLNILARQK